MSNIFVLFIYLNLVMRKTLLKIYLPNCRNLKYNYKNLEMKKYCMK